MIYLPPVMLRRYAMMPRIIIYNATSVDGRITGFDADLEAYYGEAMNWPTDAVLIGSNTLLTSEEGFDQDDKAPGSRYRRKDGILAVIPDSQGRVRNIRKLRDVPYWGEIVILCSEATPKEHLEYLEKRKVDYFVGSGNKVDLAAALEWLADKFGVKVVRVDSGGTLNGALLEAGLVDEVHVMVHPQMVGGDAHGSMFRPVPDSGWNGRIDLELKNVQKKDGDLVLLSYEVRK